MAETMIFQKKYLLMILFLLSIFIFGCNKSPEIGFGDCSLSYGAKEVIVSIPQNMTHSIEIVKDNLLSNDPLFPREKFKYDLNNETYWSKASARYVINESYSRDRLKEGWYVYIAGFNGLPQGITVFISPEGMMSEAIFHPC